MATGDLHHDPRAVGHSRWRAFSNQGGYANAELDAIIEEASETVDPEARTALYNDFQTMVVEELPLINVAEWGFTSVVRDNILNVGNNPRWVVSNWADTGFAR